VNSVKPGMSSHFSESRNPSNVSSAMCPECPGKDWRSKSFRIQSTSMGKRPRWSSTDQVAWLHLRPCLVPCWCGASRTIWNCCWSWGISGPPRASAPRLSPKERRARKWMNEYAGLRSKFLFMKLSLDCLAKVNVVFK